MYSPYGIQLNGTCENCPLWNEQSFCNLQKPVLKALEAIKFTSGYPKGVVLFVEGEDPRGVFLVCKGSVKLTMTSADGKTMILRMAGPGEALGLHAVVSGEPFQVTAETKEPCQINFVRRDDFLRFLREHGEASIRAAQQLSTSYHAACTQIRSLGLTHSASGKLAKFLLESPPAVPAAKDGTRVRMTMTHEEIGQMIGASRETVTRTLGQFKHKQLVAQRGCTIVIQNRAALESYAGA